MGLVKTPQEIAELQATMAEPKALSGEMISIGFRTRPEIVQSLLPPGLDPVPEPIGTAYVGRWGRSNAGSFEGAALYLHAQHDGLGGGYCVAMPMASEQAVQFGREMLGEAKKLCTVGFRREGDRVHGEIVRFGETILAIDATLAQEVPAQPLETAAFHYKYTHRVDGGGLEFDPLLIRVEVEHTLSRLEAGSGSLALKSTPHDPLGDIEVTETTTAFYSEGDLRGRARVLTSVSAKEFLPYAFNKMDDWTLLDNE